MKKTKIIHVRLTEKTYEKINNIRKQLISTGLFNEEELTDSYIIRESIRTLDEKAKYFIWTRDNKTSVVKH